MTVRAKFKVFGNTPNGAVLEADKGSTVLLYPVYSSDPNSENGQFYKWTPGGQISLSTINTSAASQFEVGDEFYVDFIKVDK